MAKLSEVKSALAEYEAKVAEREAKQDKHDADKAALDAAIDAETVSRDEWLEAIRVEHAAEDTFEAAAVAHEPPSLP